MLTKIDNLIYKYYVTALVFTLILFKRSVPKWMQGEIKDLIVPQVIEEPLGPTERYVR